MTHNPTDPAGSRERPTVDPNSYPYRLGRATAIIRGLVAGYATTEDAARWLAEEDERT